MSKIRIWIGENYHQTNTLSINKLLILDKNHVHYLYNVMRRNAGDIINAFNEKDGEFECKITEIRKNFATITPFKQLIKVSNELLNKELDKTQKNKGTKKLKIRVLCPFIKNVDPGFIIQKMTEIGAYEIQPVIFERSVIRKIDGEKIKKLTKVAIEAAEQSDRVSIPKIYEAIYFSDWLDECVNKNYDKNIENRNINNKNINNKNNEINIFAITSENQKILNYNESKIKIYDIATLNHTLNEIIPHCNIENNSIIINTIIGPEGGFSQKELLTIQKLTSCDNCIYLTLSNFTLRVETALILLNGILCTINSSLVKY